MDFDYPFCGCGRPVRYTTSSGGACNKYGCCMTWDEQRELIADLTKSLRDLHDFGEVSQHHRYGKQSREAFKTAGELLKQVGG